MGSRNHRTSGLDECELGGSFLWLGPDHGDAGRGGQLHNWIGVTRKGAALGYGAVRFTGVKSGRGGGRKGGEARSGRLRGGVVVGRVVAVGERRGVQWGGVGRVAVAWTYVLWWQAVTGTDSREAERGGS
jgi:hypothetical protein